MFVDVSMEMDNFGGTVVDSCLWHCIATKVVYSAYLYCDSFGYVANVQSDVVIFLTKDFGGGGDGLGLVALCAE
jgi:hypothetical protein